MEIIPTKTKGVYIQFDGKTATVLDKAELTKQLEFSQAQLASLPKPLTDKEKLKWFEENYPLSGAEQSKVLIQSEVTKLEAQIAACKE